MTQIDGDDWQRWPLGFMPPTVRPTVCVDEGNINQASKIVWRYLIESNACSQWLFRFDNGFQWVVHDTWNLVSARPVTWANMRLMLSEMFIFERQDNRRHLKTVDPPMVLVEALFARPNPPLPTLTGISPVPVVGPTGGLACDFGYNQDTKTFFIPKEGFDLPPINEAPSAPEIAAAVDRFRDLLSDMPFLDDSDFAHAMATLLVAILRPAINGPVPLLIIGKPAPANGATLLANIIAEIVTGAPAPVMVEGGNESELRKRITATLLRLPVFQLIDNLHGPLRSPALAALLTSTVWADRMLGQSHIVGLMNKTIWMVTGNNPEVSDEIARRAIWIRLDAQCARPWEGRSFRYPQIINTVRQNRPCLVVALLTVIQAWIVRDRPLSKRCLAGFEEWSAIVGGVLDVAGITGFLQQHHAPISDPNEAAWRQLVAMWLSEYGYAEVGVHELYDIARQMDIPPNIGDGNERSQRTRLGLGLQKLRDRTFEFDRHSVAVRAEDSHQNAARWRLADIRIQPNSPYNGGNSTHDDRVNPGERAVNSEPSEPRIAPREDHRSTEGTNVSPEGSLRSPACTDASNDGPSTSSKNIVQRNRVSSIVALDLGNQTGWAVRLRTGAIVSDSKSLVIGHHMGAGAKFLELSRLLAQLETLCGEIDLLVLEKVMSQSGTVAAQVYGGFLATIAAWCDTRGISYVGVPVGTIKKFATGHGNASKAMMMEFARSKGVSVKDHNQADAIALLFWTIEHYK
ncbi:hypothetical protein [Belnapia sp. F-4-1]|uniref:hypothetical protein n=1 Tax=Belnapia sp. F-4-1 TaxID=1545443 RepID=UPI001917474F|nr:hypothetical protein [Belnapia sp. F-4-1]